MNPPTNTLNAVLPVSIRQISMSIENNDILGVDQVRVRVVINGREELNCLEFFHDWNDFESRFDRWLRSLGDAMKEMLKAEHARLKELDATKRAVDSERPPANDSDDRKPGEGSVSSSGE